MQALLKCLSGGRARVAVPAEEVPKTEYVEFEQDEETKESTPSCAGSSCMITFVVVFLLLAVVWWLLVHVVHAEGVPKLPGNLIALQR